MSDPGLVTRLRKTSEWHRQALRPVTADLLIEASDALDTALQQERRVQQLAKCLSLDDLLAHMNQPESELVKLLRTFELLAGLQMTNLRQEKELATALREREALGRQVGRVYELVVGAHVRLTRPERERDLKEAQQLLESMFASPTPEDPS